MAGVSPSPYHSSIESAKEMASRLPFKIGGDVEAKSFTKGYRGAWFVCKVVEVDKGSRNQLRYKLKYRDFEDEPLHWSQAYQQRYRGQIESTELMVRPLPPAIVSKEDLSKGSQVGTIVVPFGWEVGDLVDWFYDKVWWEATITVVGRERLKVSLWKPPQGEGGNHWAEPKHLRPSLVWSFSDSWSVPISQNKTNGKPAAKIIEVPSRAVPKAGDVNGQLSTPAKQLSMRGQLPGSAKQPLMRGQLPEPATQPVTLPASKQQAKQPATQPAKQQAKQQAKQPAKQSAKQPLMRGELPEPTKQPLMRVKPDSPIELRQGALDSVAKPEFNNLQPKDGKNLDLKTVPLLEELRKATQPFVNRRQENKSAEKKTDGKPSKLYLENVKPKRRISGPKVNSLSSGDLDWDEIYAALRERKKVFKRRIGKFIRYRKHVNRAVEIRCKR